jgi:hypothetical protein
VEALSAIYDYLGVSRQLQAVDCDIDGRIVMEEIAWSVRSKGLAVLNISISHVDLDNQAIIHSSF